MGKTSNVIASGVLALSLVLSVAACSGAESPVQVVETPADETEQAPAVLDQAFIDYVEAERAQIPNLLEMYPGLYSDVLIDGSLEESTGEDGIPAGTYSVITFTYVYADAMDWTQTSPILDEQRPMLESACNDGIFPAIRNAGVTGPLGVLYAYDDVASTDGPMWTHACTLESD